MNRSGKLMTPCWCNRRRRPNMPRVLDGTHITPLPKLMGITDILRDMQDSHMPVQGRTGTAQGKDGFTGGFADAAAAAAWSRAPNAPNWRYTRQEGSPQARQQERDTRPTAAELHPQGFGPAFRASISDLQTLATFCHEGAVWQPKVKDVKWCRPDGDARRVQLSFIADYTSSRSRGNTASPLVQLLQTSSCDALHTSFQEHLDRVAGRCDCRQFPGCSCLIFLVVVSCSFVSSCGSKAPSLK